MNISELLQQQHYLLNTLYDAPMQFNQQVDQAKQRLDQQVDQAKQRLEQRLKEIEKERSDSKGEAIRVCSEVEGAYFKKFKYNHHYLDEAKKYIEKVKDEYIAMQRKPDLTVNENSIRSRMQDLGKVSALFININEKFEPLFKLLVEIGCIPFIPLLFVCAAISLAIQGIARRNIQKS
jgi:hypothetical protein